MKNKKTIGILLLGALQALASYLAIYKGSYKEPEAGMGCRIGAESRQRK